MNKIKTVKIKNLDGSISEESYTITTDAQYVDMDNGKDLQETIGNIDVDNDGSINQQLNDDIDEMKAYNLVEGDTVVTKGYYNSNDNGGCVFIVKSASLKTNVTLNNGLVAELIKDNSIVKYIFPKNWNSISGDVNLIIAYGKVILIDSHDTSYKNNLYSMLEKYNINHIDYFISTHYHKDHIGNFINLINDGYVDKNTNIYLPCYVAHLMTEGTSMYTYYNNISQVLNNAGLTGIVPNEKDTIELGFGFKITFYNCEPQIFENYTDYNECSTVCLVEHNSIKSLYTGDCGYLRRFIDEEIIEDKVHLYKIEHHGINNNSNAVYLLRFILPDYAVQPSGMLDETINNYSTSQTITFLKAIGTKIYSVHENPEEIEFISENEQIKNIKGNENYVSSGGKFTISLYCDSNTTNTKQNGTSQYPYKDLPQALEHILQTQVGEYNIYLADGEYNTQHSITAKNIGRIRNSKITIIGNTDSNIAVKIKNYLEIFNSNVLIKYVNFVGTGSDSIRPYNSYLRVENCSFTIDANSTAKVGIYSNDGCNIVVLNCSFNGNTMGISAHNGDNVCVTNCSFENLTDFYLVMTDATLREANNTVINCTNPTIKYYNSGCDIFSGFTRPRELFSGSQLSGEITLSDNITNYNCLIVTTGTLGGTGLKTGFLIAYTDGYFKRGSKYRFAAISDDIIITVDNTTPNKITIAHSNTGTDEIRTIYGVHMKYYR